MNRNVIGTLIFVFVITSFAHNNETIKNITEAYQSELINYEEALLQKFYTVFDQSKLKSEYLVTSQSAVKCATHLVSEYRKNRTQLSEQTRSIIDQFINVDLKKSNNDKVQATYISPYQKFELTYSTSGGNAVPAQDLDNSGIPDYVERVAEYFDHSWRVLIDTLGFKEIPLNVGEYYQISFENMGAYGYTTWNGSSAGTEIVMHNTYQGFPSNTDPDGNVLGAAKVTAVHEFKHAIQFVYNNWGEPGWFIEADATWSEDIGFDLTNDYYNYLGASQIRQPGRGLANGDGYEDNLFFHFFTEKYGDDTNREIWERREQFNESVYSSVTNMLANYGALFDEAFAEYYTWLYNTGNRYNPNLPGFGEAADYPTSVICTDVDTLPNVDTGCNRDALSANFLVFNSQQQNQFLQLVLDTPNGNNYASVITTYTDNSTNIEYYELSNSELLDLFIQPKLDEIEEIVVAVVVTSVSGSNFDYVYSFDAFQTAEFAHTPFGDTESTGDIEFLVNVETPQNLAIIDSLKLFYQLNSSGYQSQLLVATGNQDEYSATISNPGDDVQIDYYFRIADQLNQKVYYPETAPDSVFSFYVGTDQESPVLTHNSLTGTPKYNFPLPVYAEITDNISLDSTYLEYRINEGDWSKLDMVMLEDDIFFGSLDFETDQLSEGDLIDYRIIAVDGSSNNNKTQVPETDFYRLDVTEGYYFNGMPDAPIRQTNLFLQALQDTITVTDDFPIEDLNIFVQIDSLYFSEITLELFDPEGNKYILYDQDWDQTTKANAGDPAVIIDQEAFFTFEKAVLTDLLFAQGTFAPVAADLTQIYGTSVHGEWILRVYDKAINDSTGNLLEWGLIVEGENLTSVDEKETVVTKFSLSQNYPNPFNPTTTIKFTVPDVGTSRDLSIRVYDVLGREVKTLVNEQKSPGSYSVTFDAANLSSGIYFYTLKSGSFVQTRKMILLR